MVSLLKSVLWISDHLELPRTCKTEATHRQYIQKHVRNGENMVDAMSNLCCVKSSYCSQLYMSSSKIKLKY